MLNFNSHFELEGRHALLSASKYHWLNYSDEKIANTFFTAMLAAKGTRLHEFAKEAILLKIKLPKTQKTLHMFVNDAIGWDMIPEQILFYSRNAFGTTDAISLKVPKIGRPTLRIHDLKTGVGKTSTIQLEIYAALFCLEYDFKPPQLDMILRIYQNDEIIEEVPDPARIIQIMDRIVSADKIIERLREEAA